MPASDSPPEIATTSSRWGSFFHIAPSGLLAVPHDASSGLNSDAQARIDAIHSDTGASITIHIHSLSGVLAESTVIGSTRGMDYSNVEETVMDAFAPSEPLDKASLPRQTDKLLVFIIGSSIESVSVAQVQVLVLADQMSGMSAIHVEVDPKLQPILAGRQRAIIAMIERDTATRIYLPRQLNGVFAKPNPSSEKHNGYHHLAYAKPRFRPPQFPQVPHHRARPMCSDGFPGNGYDQQSRNGIHSQWAGITMASPDSTGSWPTDGHLNPEPYSRPPAFINHQIQHQPMPDPAGLQQPLHTQNRPGFAQPNPPHRPTFSPRREFQGSQQFPSMNRTEHPVRPAWQNPDQMLPQPNDTAAQPRFPSHTNGSSGLLSPSPTMSSAGTNGYYPIRPTNGMAGPSSPIYTTHSRRSSVASQRFSTAPGHHDHALDRSGPSAPVQYSARPPPFYPNAGSGQIAGGLLGHTGNQIPHPFRPPFAHDQRKPRIPDSAVEQPAIDRFGPLRHPGIGICGPEQGNPRKACQIHITGQSHAVHAARDLLLQILRNLEFNVLSRDLALKSQQLDWILTWRLAKVRKIMDDNGTYIQMPLIGSKSEVVTVFGSHHTHIERSLRSLARLATELYEAFVWLVPNDTYGSALSPDQDPNLMQALAAQVSRETGAAVAFKPRLFELQGTQEQVKAGCQEFIRNEALSGSSFKVVFRFELAKEFQAFYGGLRLGKIAKIKKTYNVDVALRPFHDYNFVIEVSGTDPTVIDGFQAALDGLPTQISFHIPEMYHRRIIGERGSNVQSITSRFQCFIKCCSPEEQAALGGYDESHDNVLMYSPARNRGNLELAKQAVLEMVAPEDRYYISRPVQIDRYYHQILSVECSTFLQDGARQTRTMVRFPYSETGSDTITIFGPAMGVDVMTRLILDMLPPHADVQLPRVADLSALVASPEFGHFCRQIHARHAVDITLNNLVTPGSQLGFTLRGDQVPKERVRELLTRILEGHDFVVHVITPDILDISNGSATSPSLYEQGTITNRHGHNFNNGTSVPIPVSEDSGRPDLVALFREPAQLPIVGNGNGFASALDTPNRHNLTAAWHRTQPVSVEAEVNGTRRPSSKRDSDPVILRRINCATLARLPRGSASRTQSLDVTQAASRRTFGFRDSDFVPEDESAIIAHPNETALLRQHNTGEARSGVDGIAQSLNNTRI